MKRSKLLTAEIVNKAKEELKKRGKKGFISVKLMAIIAAEKNGITTAAHMFNTTKKSLIEWIKRLDDSINQLEVQAGRGRKSLLKSEQKVLIKSWILQDPQMTIDKLKITIEKEMNICLGRSTTHRLMKDLEFSYITPRPRHYKQEAEALEEAKKKSD